VATLNVDFSYPGLTGLARQASFPQKSPTQGDGPAFAEFACADCLRLPLRPGGADVVVDKGLFDAMVDCDDAAGAATATALFRELGRCLRFDGSGACVVVTLAQAHVLALLARAVGLDAGPRLADAVEASDGGGGGGGGAQVPSISASVPRSRFLWSSVSVQPAGDPTTARSPLQPFVVTLVRALGDDGAGEPPRARFSPRRGFGNVGGGGDCADEGGFGGGGDGDGGDGGHWMAWAEVAAAVEGSRAAFAEAVQRRCGGGGCSAMLGVPPPAADEAFSAPDEEAGPGSKRALLATHVLFTVDLKPEELETDLTALEAAARALNCDCYMADGVGGGGGGGGGGSGFGRLRFTGCARTAVGFGLSKLVLEGTLPLGGCGCGAFPDVEAVCEALGELEGAMSADEAHAQPCSLR